MKIRMALVVSVAWFGVTDSVFACGGGGGSFAKGGGSIAKSGPIASMGGRGPSMASRSMVSPVSLMKQSAVAQANAYNNRMRPIRMANAAKVRQQKLARREARKAVMLAQMNERKAREQAFLARARRWTDSSGDHELTAVLEDANSWGVKLRKQDGTSVNVPMDRLSRLDREWVHDRFQPGNEENRLMLAGL